MSAEHFPLSEEQIFAAERLRATENVAKAVQVTQSAIEFPLQDFAQLPEDDKKRPLMASRINVVANKSRADRSWEAPTVAHYLGETRRGIVTVYRNPAVQEATGKINEDTRGNPYEFKTETAGDEVGYLMTLSVLTENTAFLNLAAQRMNQIIEAAEEPTAKTLARFRHNRLAHRANPTGETFNALRQSYEQSTQASEEISRWEQVATIASLYAIDALSKWWSSIRDY